MLTFRGRVAADAASPIAALRRARSSAALRAAIASYFGVVAVVIVYLLVGKFSIAVAVVAVGYVAILSAMSTT
jgi:hypothetical protein